MELSLRDSLYLRDGDSHRWMLPAAGIEIRMAADALARMSRDTAVLRKRARPDEQIGGLLLGSVDAVGRVSVRISAVETHSAEALHRLLAAVSRNPVEALEEDGVERSVVGWFRIVAAPDDHSPADEALQRECFRERHEVGLLIAPEQVRVLFRRGAALGSIEAEFPGLLPSRPEAPVPAPAPVAETGRGIRREWRLLALTLITAVLVFSGGVLWDHRRGGQAGAAGRNESAAPATPQLAWESVEDGWQPLDSVPQRTPQQPRTVTATREFSPLPAAEAPADDPISLPAPPAASAPVASQPGAAAALATISSSPPPVPEPAPASQPVTPANSPAPERQQAGAAPATAAPAAARVIQAVPLRQSQPVIPINLRGLITRPIAIEVRAMVDPSGRVVEARATDTAGLAGSLARLAENAARMWTYRPATYNGRPVLSEARIRFTFAPSR
jgi:hypothetical protein